VAKFNTAIGLPLDALLKLTATVVLTTAISAYALQLLARQLRSFGLWHSDSRDIKNKGD